MKAEFVRGRVHGFASGHDLYLSRGLLRAATKLHAPRLGNQQLQMLDLANPDPRVGWNHPRRLSNTARIPKLHFTRLIFGTDTGVNTNSHALFYVWTVRGG